MSNWLPSHGAAIGFFPERFVAFSRQLESVMGVNRRKEPEKYGRRAGGSSDTDWRRRGTLRHFPITQYGHRQRKACYPLASHSKSAAPDDGLE